MVMAKNIKRKDQNGFASIVIALTLITILALLTIGFAQLARKEQQTSLNQELSNQANYAAESGIADTVKDIENNVITSSNTTTCLNSHHGLTSKNINDTTNSGVQYTCVFVNLTPTTLDFNHTSAGQGQYLTFTTPQPITTLDVDWGSGDGQTNVPSSFSTPNEFPSDNNWGGSLPVIQYSLTSIPNPSAISRADLINDTFNAVLYPTSLGSSTYATNENNQVVPVTCGTQSGKNPYPCNVSFENFNSYGATTYVLHYVSYYDNDPNINISAYNGTTPLTFTGQIEVDSTGKARNTLSRVQVRLSATGVDGTIGESPILPDNAIQSGNVCKKIQTQPLATDYYNINGSVVDNYVAPGTEDPCDLNVND